MEQEEKKADQGIQEFLIDLGRRHFSYGANTSHMELLGLVFVETLLPLFHAEDQERPEGGGDEGQAWRAVAEDCAEHDQAGQEECLTGLRLG